MAAINKPPQKFEGAKLAVVLLLLLVSGSCNFVLLKILFAAYGEASAFFVSQGINVLYIVYGGMVVYPRLLPCGLGDRFSRAFGFGPILPSMRTLEHHRRFLVMGVLDCSLVQNSGTLGQSMCTEKNSIYSNCCCSSDPKKIILKNQTISS